MIGEWEGRQFFRETDDNVAKETLIALANGLTPIVCLGETQEDRDAGLAEGVLRRQFSGGPGALTPEEFSRILIAYEPVWAIGTGRTATPEIAADAHRFLRACAGGRIRLRRLAPHELFHSKLSGADHRRAAPERQGRRPRRSLRRRRQPDGVRSARCR